MSRLRFALLTIDTTSPKTGDPAGRGSVWPLSPRRARKSRDHHCVSPSVFCLPYYDGQSSGESAHAAGALRSWTDVAATFKIGKINAPAINKRRGRVAELLALVAPAPSMAITPGSKCSRNARVTCQNPWRNARRCADAPRVRIHGAMHALSYNGTPSTNDPAMRESKRINT
jgi:hypothetical protein